MKTWPRGMQLVVCTCITVIVVLAKGEGLEYEAMSEDQIFLKPFVVCTDGYPLDTSTSWPHEKILAGSAIGQSFSDSAGHSAPFLVDLDGDGRRDLIVGSFSGRFRFYRNFGPDEAPHFATSLRT